jgi:hypothetical protein
MTSKQRVLFALDAVLVFAVVFSMSYHIYLGGL